MNLDLKNNDYLRGTQLKLDDWNERIGHGSHLFNSSLGSHSFENRGKFGEEMGVYGPGKCSAMYESCHVRTDGDGLQAPISIR
jgi:hypothetical protein